MGIDGMGPDTPETANERGARQSDIPYRFDLLPTSALFAVAQVLKRGAEKYGVDNWRGLSVEEILNHALAHGYAHLGGDTQEQHLANMACRSLMALENHLSERELREDNAAPARVGECWQPYRHPEHIATMGIFCCAIPVHWEPDGEPGKIRP
jgi:hypothetical protein